MPLPYFVICYVVYSAKEIYILAISVRQEGNHAVKVGGSGWATDGARVEEGVGTVAVAAPEFSNEGWGLRIM